MTQMLKHSSWLILSAIAIRISTLYVSGIIHLDYYLMIKLV